jgi:hypothetical protein
MSSKSPIEIRLGEAILIYLDDGDIISGNVADKTERAIRLADAFFMVEDPETGKLVPSGRTAASFGLIEIPYANISSLQALSVGI